MTGAILNDGVRGDQLWLDLHSLAVFGEPTKLVSMTVSGLALLWLGLSGWYLFFYPLWFKLPAPRLRRSEPQQRDRRMKARTDGTTITLSQKSPGMAACSRPEPQPVSCR